MKVFTNRVAVVTGAGSGIGRELARQLAAAGAKLALNDWNESSLLETRQLLNITDDKCLLKAFDVSDRTAVYNFAQEVANHFGQVDLVINNAGTSSDQRPIERTPLEDFERIINVNLWGVIYGSKAFLPFLAQRQEAALVNISSVFGIMGYPNQGPYVVTKFGVRGFTETLRIELAQTMPQINVSCVHPGGIRTNIIKNIKTSNKKGNDKLAKQFERMAPTLPEEAARTILEGVNKQKARILIGKDARFISLITRLFPSWYERILLRKYDVERFSVDQK